MRIGIDLGGSHIGIGLVLEGNILEIREKVFTQQDKKDIKKAIIENTISIIDEILLAQNIDKKEIELIGIASPGLISGGSIVKASNLSIFDFNICEEIEKMTGIKTQLRNDAKCAAICEKEYGALKEYTDCIFLSLGTGIGGAAFIDGKLLEPNGFSGFEFGHMVIEKDGILCTCGKKGCFERYCSIKALKNRITEALHISNDVSGKYLREEILNRTDKEIDEGID